MNLWDTLLGWCAPIIVFNYIYILDYLKIVATKWLQDLNLNYTSCTPLCRGLVQGASIWISGELHKYIEVHPSFPKVPELIVSSVWDCLLYSHLTFLHNSCKVNHESFEKTQVTPKPRNLTLVGGLSRWGGSRASYRPKTCWGWWNSWISDK